MSALSPPPLGKLVELTTFSDNFMDDMAPALRSAYASRLPFCRKTVLAMVAQVGSAGFLSDVRGPIPAEWQPTLDDVWVRPYRAYMERSGKFLRPFLVCLCLEAYGREPASNPAPVALAEMIHSASLLLDDIVDDSRLRRGGPTAHTQIGIRASGTVASAWLNSAFEVLRLFPGSLSEPERQALMREIAWEHWVTGIGTVIDCVWPTLPSLHHAPAEYLQSVVHRSTSYTYRLPLKIGAIAAGAPASEVRQFALLGEELGISFQLVDDILNLKPGDEHWGKTVAEDLTEGKITLQVLLALEHAEPAAGARLVEILRARTLEPALLREAIAIIESSGAFEHARQRAQVHVARTHEIVKDMTFLPAHTQQVLREFVDYVVERSR
jgi:geranylgeranyl diphosphate synthase type I/geranylgeranyl diphosphate synthase type II